MRLRVHAAEIIITVNHQNAAELKFSEHISHIHQVDTTYAVNISL